MTTLPAVPGVARIAVSGTNHDQPWANVFHVKTGGDLDLSGTGVAELAADFGAAFTTSFYPIMSQQCGARECTVIQLSGETAPSAAVPLTGAGNVSGDIATLSTCKLLKWNISRRYRGGHPRTYLGGVPENDVSPDGRLFLDAAIAGTQAAANAFLAAVNAIDAQGDTLKLCVVHYMKNNATLPVPLVDDVLSVTAVKQIATQRRRLH